MECAVLLQIGTIGGNLYMKYFNNDFQSDLFLLFETVGAMLTIGWYLSGIFNANLLNLVFYT